MLACRDFLRKTGSCVAVATGQYSGDLAHHYAAVAITVRWRADSSAPILAPTTTSGRPETASPHPVRRGGRSHIVCCVVRTELPGATAMRHDVSGWHRCRPRTGDASPFGAALLTPAATVPPPTSATAHRMSRQFFVFKHGSLRQILDRIDVVVRGGDQPDARVGTHRGERLRPCDRAVHPSPSPVWRPAPSDLQDVGFDRYSS